MPKADRTGADRDGAGPGSPRAPRPRRNGRPDPEWRWSDSLAMVIAGLQVVLPFVAIIIVVTVVAYLFVALLFR
jgi:hypothetical protein